MNHIKNKHSKILKKLENGEIYMVGNAGSIIYEKILDR